jgi:hypothetical protein
VPLRYRTANRIADEFDICQRWLATGKLPVTYYISIAPRLASELSDESLFSQAYDTVLAPWIDSHIEGIAETLSCKEEEVSGQHASAVSANAAGAEAWEIIRNTLATIATLERNRAGKKSDGFVEKFTSLFDRIFTRSPSALADAKDPGSLAGVLIHQVHEYCEEMTRENGVNFMKQVIHYASNLHDNYTKPRPSNLLALANSKDAPALLKTEPGSRPAKPKKAKVSKP